MKKIFSILMFLVVFKTTFAATTVTTTTAQLDTAYCQHTYSYILAVTGGAAPYTWSISSGTLPTGLILDAKTGRISGQLHYYSNTSKTFTVRAKDKNNVEGTKSLTMYIVNNTVTWSNIYNAWKSIPNTYPNNGQIYDTWRLNTGSSTPAVSGWGLTGNSITDTKFLGSTNNENVTFKRNNVKKLTLTDLGVDFGVENIRSDYGVLSHLDYGPYNVSLGVGSMAYIDDGNFNTAIGADALGGNGMANTAVGSGVLNDFNGSSYNTAVGYSTLHDWAAGGSNTAIGALICASNPYTSGSNNTLIGSSIIPSAEYCDENIVVGHNSGTTTDSLNDNIIIGNDAVLGSNLVSGNTLIGNNLDLSSMNAPTNNLIIGDGTGTHIIQSEGDTRKLTLNIQGGLTLLASAAPAASTLTAANKSFPIVINGVTYYLMLSTTP